MRFVRICSLVVLVMLLLPHVAESESPAYIGFGAAKLSVGMTEEEARDLLAKGHSLVQPEEGANSQDSWFVNPKSSGDDLKGVVGLVTFRSGVLVWS